MVVKKKPAKKSATKKPKAKKVIKKAVVKSVTRKPVTIKPATSKLDRPIGKVVHYFDHIKVAVIKLNAPLVLDDTIKISGGKETDFEQKVVSMEVDHQKITKAKKAQEVGLKVKEKVHEGYKVYKIRV